jgi:hypothetical protein
MLVCIPNESLSPEHAEQADETGIEYLFMFKQRHKEAVVSRHSWHTLLRRFHPSIIHICPDVPLSVGARVARLGTTHGIPVLMETPALNANNMGEMSTADAEWQRRAKPHYRWASQLACPDLQTLAWYREMLRFPAYRLSLVGPKPTPMDSHRRSEVPGEKVLLVANRKQARAMSETHSLARLISRLLVEQPTLRVAAYSSFRRHLEGSPSGVPSEVANRLTYVKKFADWLSILVNATAVIGAGGESGVWREIGAAEAGDVPAILATGDHLDDPRAALEVLSLLETEHSMSDSAWDLDAEASCLLAIYDGVYLREHLR